MAAGAAPCAGTGREGWRGACGAPLGAHRPRGARISTDRGARAAKNHLTQISVAVWHDLSRRLCVAGTRVHIRHR